MLYNYDNMIICYQAFYVWIFLYLKCVKLRVDLFARISDLKDKGIFVLASK